jgi:cytochrome b561
MVVMPLTGWALISANPPIGSAGAAAVAAARAASTPAASGGGETRRQARRAPRTVWGVVPLPEIRTLERIGATPEGVPLQKALHDDLVETHSVGAFLTIALLVLHLVGALKHQWIDGHAELARMGAGRVRPRGTGH